MTMIFMWTTKEVIIRNITSNCYELHAWRGWLEFNGAFNTIQVILRL